MSKKIKRKKNKKRTAKEEPKPTLPGGMKISEAVLRISEPLLTRFREPHKIENIISLTVMAWNISIFEGEERTELQEKTIEKFPQDFGGEDIALLLDNIEMLIARKDKLFPDIREYIIDHKVSFSGSSYNLTVGAVPVGDRKKKASP